MNKAYIEALRRIEQSRKSGGTELNLSGFDLQVLPPDIGKLSYLEYLFLSHNQLASLPPKIGQLVNLRILILDDNQLTSLPPEMDKLINLRVLGVVGNKLTSLPPEIDKLVNLRVMDLNDNQLTSLPPEMDKLRKLTTLYIGRNSLTSLPPEIGQLRKLTSLNLRNNQLTSLPPEIGQLRKLAMLFLDGNQLTSLPPEIGQLRKLTSLNLRNNQLPEEILAVHARGLPALFDYLQLVEIEGARVCQVKLVLVGEGDVGKTTLLRALQGLGPEEGIPTTEGIDIAQEHVPLAHPDGGHQIELNAWDFAGQKSYHITHQFFFSKDAVYLLVWNPLFTPEKCDVAGWLERIKLRVGNEARVLIVSTYSANEEPLDRLDESGLKETFGELIHGFFPVDGMHHNSTPELRAQLQRLKAAIAEAAAPLTRRTLPRSWQAARKEISSLDCPCITLEEFVQRCGEHGLTPDNAASLAVIMDRLGDVVYFENAQQDAAPSDSHVVLRPEWLAKAIGFLLEDRRANKGSGVLEHADLYGIWFEDRTDPYRYGPELHRYFLWLMEQFNISYRLDEQRSLVPQLVTSARPDNLPFEPGIRPPTGVKEMSLVCTMSEAPPPGILPLLIVQCHPFRRKPMTDPDSNWTSGAFICRPEHGMAFIELQDRELRFTVHAQYPRYFTSDLQKALESLIARYWPGLTYTMWVLCPGDMNRGNCKGRFSLSALLAAKSEGEATYPCQECHHKHSIDGLLFGFETALADLERSLAASLRRELSLALYAFRRSLDIIGSEAQRAPNMFSLARIERGKAMDKYRLNLWCEWPEAPHPCCVPGTRGSGEFEFKQPRKWLAQAAPWVSWTLRILKAAVPVGGALLKDCLDPELLKDMNFGTDTAVAAAEALPSGELDAKRVHVPDGAGARLTEGDSLRMFHDLLDVLAQNEESEKEGRKKVGRNWGDMRCVENLWLCPQHAAIYKPGVPERDFADAQSSMAIPSS